MMCDPYEYYDGVMGMCRACDNLCDRGHGTWSQCQDVCAEYVNDFMATPRATQRSTENPENIEVDHIPGPQEITTSHMILAAVIVVLVLFITVLLVIKRKQVIQVLLIIKNKTVIRFPSKDLSRESTSDSTISKETTKRDDSPSSAHVIHMDVVTAGSMQLTSQNPAHVSFDNISKGLPSVKSRSNDTSTTYIEDTTTEDQPGHELEPPDENVMDCNVDEDDDDAIDLSFVPGSHSNKDVLERDPRNGTDRRSEHEYLLQSSREEVSLCIEMKEDLEEDTAELPDTKGTKPSPPYDTVFKRQVSSGYGSQSAARAVLSNHDGETGVEGDEEEKQNVQNPGLESCILEQSMEDVFTVLDGMDCCRSYFVDDGKLEIQVDFSLMDYLSVVRELKASTGLNEIDFKIRQHMPSEYTMYSVSPGQECFTKESGTAKHSSTIGAFVRKENDTEESIYALTVGHAYSVGDECFVPSQPDSIGQCVEVLHNFSPPTFFDLAIIKLKPDCGEVISTIPNSSRQPCSFRFPASAKELEDKTLYKCQRKSYHGWQYGYFRHTMFTSKEHGIYRARTAVRTSSSSPNFINAGDCGCLMTSLPQGQSLIVYGMMTGCLVQEAEDGGDPTELCIGFPLDAAIKASRTFFHSGAQFI